jgi:hypothetical protein
MNKRLITVLIGLAVFLIILLGAGFFLVLADVLSSGTVAEATATSASTTQATTVAQVDTTPTGSPTELPAPAVQVLMTDTPLPTDTPTPTPLPTDTPEATATPEPTATNTRAPVVFVPTNTPVPVPPTNTPVPPPPPQDTRGLVGTGFTLLPNSVFAVNQDIWFSFGVANNSGGPVPYGALGALPKKNGVDRSEWFKMSWGGNNDSIQTGGLTAEDWIKLPETGSYTLRLVICFDAVSACKSGASPWITLSPEIPVTIN